MFLPDPGDTCKASLGPGLWEVYNVERLSPSSGGRLKYWNWNCFPICRDNSCFGLNSLGPLCLWQCFFSLLLETGAEVSSHWRSGILRVESGLWWPLLLFAKGSVKSPPLADFWIIAFEHFHYVTAFVIFAKYFLFLQNVDILVEEGISCNDTTSLLQNHPIKRSLGDAVPAHKFSIFVAIPEENSQRRHKKV